MTIQLSSIRTQLSAVKWLILLGLIWSQLAYANHPFLHDIAKSGDADEPCRACMSLERLEGALELSDTPALPPKSAAGKLTRTIGPGSALPVTAYSARASPQRLQ